jgi:hypothetical protein
MNRKPKTKVAAILVPLDEKKMREQLFMFSATKQVHGLKNQEIERIMLTTYRHMCRGRTRRHRGFGGMNHHTEAFIESFRDIHEKLKVLNPTIVTVVEGRNMNDIGFPGGSIAGDESHEEGLAREVLEETGIDLDTSNEEQKKLREKHGYGEIPLKLTDGRKHFYFLLIE